MQGCVGIFDWSRIHWPSVSPKIPAGSRFAARVALLGVVAGLVTVAFHYSVEWIYGHSIVAAARLGTGGFLVASFASVDERQRIGVMDLKKVEPTAGGGGVMPTKIAFWRIGVMPFRTAVAKFLGSTLTLGGGVSMGPDQSHEGKAS